MCAAPTALATALVTSLVTALVTAFVTAPVTGGLPQVVRCQFVVQQGQQLQEVAAIYSTDWLQLW